MVCLIARVPPCVYAVPAPLGVDFQSCLGTQTKHSSSLETLSQFQLTQWGFASSQQTERRYGCLDVPVTGPLLEDFTYPASALCDRLIKICYH